MAILHPAVAAGLFAAILARRSDAASVCGTSRADALARCSTPGLDSGCPGGADGECLTGQHCFANVTCNPRGWTGHDNSLFCGRSFADAAASCAVPCHGGLGRFPCPPGQRCFAHTGCGSRAEAPALTPGLRNGTSSASPTAVAPRLRGSSGGSFCGSSWGDAAARCAAACPGGVDGECPVGQRCYANTGCTGPAPVPAPPSRNGNFCGNSWGNAAVRCAAACPGGLDSECPAGQHCYANTGCAAPAPVPPPAPAPPSGNGNFCGRSWGDAAARCAAVCPGGLDSECSGGQRCYANTGCTGPAPGPVPSPTPPSPLPPSEFCVTQQELICINEKSGYWPQCDPGQAKNVQGPAGYEFGYYCSREWTDALNAMLSNSVVGKCRDRDAVRKLLAQVAYETGYYSTVYQPRDGGSGLVHMIPGNWPINAGDMDALWPGQGYAARVASMQQRFFQTPAYGWLSVAAWFKRTNRVIPGCNLDLFDQPYDVQTRCILGRVVDRSEALGFVTSCLP